MPKPSFLLPVSVPVVDGSIESLRTLGGTGAAWEVAPITFTRGSTATRTNKEGVVEVAAPYNLLTYSEQFNNAVWTKPSSTISVDTTVAPNGTLTADTLNVTATQFSGIFQTLLNLTGSYTFSIYAKKGTKNWLYFIGLSGSASNAAWFNLDTGVIGTVSAGITATIQSVGDGWYRCTATDSRTGTGYFQIGLSDANQSQTPASAGTAFIWGAQLVAGSDPLPYQETVTRLAVPRLDYRNADGTLSATPRLLLEPQRTNSIRNSSMVGAVAGSPGTLPTNWSFGSGGLSTQVVSIGTDNGLPYFDLRLFGTATNSSASIRLDTNTGIAATPSQNWSTSCYVKQTSVTIPSTSLGFSARDSSSAFISSQISNITITNNLNQVFVVGTTPANTAFLQPALNFFLTIGQTYDFTIRIAAPQMELGAYATTWVPTTTSAVTRIADAFTRNNIYTNGLISSAGGTWFVDFSNNVATARDSVSGMYIGDAGANTGNQFIIRAGTAGKIIIMKYISGVSTSLFTDTTNNVKIAIKWNGSTADVFVNGSKVVTATSFTTTLMENFASGTPVPFYINQTLLAPTPLSDAECIALTTL